MNETLRFVAAAATGAVMAGAVLVGQPALAGAAHVAKNSVTSKSIKNGTIKTKDLNADVNASLAKANSAVQSVAGYSAAQAGTQDITGNSSFTTVISKALPAGTYIVNAKATLAATYSDNTQGASEQCELTDGTNTDTSQVSGGMGTVFIFHRHVGMASLAMPVTGPKTVTLLCKNDLNAPPSGYTLSVSAARIVAVQTSSNN